MILSTSGVDFMLAEERQRRILETLGLQKAVTVSELCSLLGASESTIRRDLVLLDQKKQLTKVHGGATNGQSGQKTTGPPSDILRAINGEEKRNIAQYAASLINPKDLVFIDGGSTMEWLTECLADTDAFFITCSVDTAKLLAQRGRDVLLLGGRFCEISNTVIGPETTQMLMGYNFSKGFFGASGITRQSGCTCTGLGDAATKKQALMRCCKPYVLADSTKFGVVCVASFAEFDTVQYITTTALDPEYKTYPNVIQVPYSA
jgi:DeoR family transcriptional regulator, fructose operon transcriptional repressor